MPDRYYIDERGGCIAVRDRERTDPDYPGLHADTEGVVWFAMGEQSRVTCPHCKHESSGGWDISDDLRAKAKRIAEEMNKAMRDPWVPCESERPPRLSNVVYRTAEGDMLVADEWRDEDHLSHATHWLRPSLRRDEEVNRPAGE